MNLLTFHPHHHHLPTLVDFNPVHFEGEDDGRPDKPPNELKVALVRARNLPIMDKNMFSKGGSSDPIGKNLILKFEI